MNNRDGSFKWALAAGVGLVACGPEAPQPVGNVGSEPVGFAVVASDRTVSSVSLLGPEGELLAPRFIHSGSATAGLVTALSGDVVVPTRSGDPGALTLLDRLRTDVVTRVDPNTGEVLGQVKTHEPNDDEGDEASFSSNPQDYTYWGERDAWVTRFQPNVAAEAGHPDRGLDLLHIDPTDFERGERISFWPLNSQADRQNPDTLETESVTSYARPSAMVRLGDKLVVGIASLSLAFDAAGPGLVAWVDPETQSVQPFELPGLQNCGNVAPVAGDPARVVVACEGFFRGVPRDTAGLAILNLENDELAIEHLWRGAEHPEAALAVSSVVSLGGSSVVAVALGQRAITDDAGNETRASSNDQLYRLDIATGEQEAVLEAEGRFVLGPGAFLVTTGLLLVPDASSDDDGRPTAGVRRLQLRPSGGLGGPGCAGARPDSTPADGAPLLTNATPPARRIFVGGGVRSGKSRFALSLALRLGRERLFVATAEALDDEMQERIERHQRERGHEFHTVEEPLELPERLRAASGFDVVLVDCLTLWLSNLLVRGRSEPQVLSAVDALVRAVEASPAHVVLVSNEVGLGLVPESHLGRLFRDVAGATHTRVAAVADEVYFAALGLVIRLRPNPVEALSPLTQSLP